MNFMSAPGDIREVYVMSLPDLKNTEKNNELEFQQFKNHELTPTPIDFEYVTRNCSLITNILSSDEYTRLAKAVIKRIHKYLKVNIDNEEMRRRFRIRRDDRVTIDEKTSRRIVTFGALRMSGCLVNMSALYKPPPNCKDPLISTVRYIKESKVNHQYKDSLVIPNKKRRPSAAQDIRITIYGFRSFRTDIDKWFQKIIDEQLSSNSSSNRKTRIDIEPRSFIGERKKKRSLIESITHHKFEDVYSLRSDGSCAVNQRCKPVGEESVFESYTGLLCISGARKDITTLSHNSATRSREVTGAYDELMSKYSIVLLFWLMSTKGLFIDGMDIFYIRNVVTSFIFNPDVFIDRLRRGSEKFSKLKNDFENSIGDKNTSKNQSNTNTFTKNSHGSRKTQIIDLKRLSKSMGNIIRYDPKLFPAAFFTPHRELIVKACQRAYALKELEEDIYYNQSMNAWLSEKERNIRDQIRQIAACDKLQAIKNIARKEKENLLSKTFIDKIRDKIQILIYAPGSVLITGSKNKEVSSALSSIFHKTLTDIMEQTALEDREDNLYQIFQQLEQRNHAILKKIEHLTLPQLTKLIDNISSSTDSSSTTARHTNTLISADDQKSLVKTREVTKDYKSFIKKAESFSKSVKEFNATVSRHDGSNAVDLKINNDRLINTLKTRKQQMLRHRKRKLAHNLHSQSASDLLSLSKNKTLTPLTNQFSMVNGDETILGSNGADSNDIITLKFDRFCDLSYPTSDLSQSSYDKKRWVTSSTDVSRYAKSLRSIDEQVEGGDRNTRDINRTGMSKLFENFKQASKLATVTDKIKEKELSDPRNFVRALGSEKQTNLRKERRIKRLKTFHNLRFKKNLRNVSKDAKSDQNPSVINNSVLLSKRTIAKKALLSDIIENTAELKSHALKESEIMTDDQLQHKKPYTNSVIPVCSNQYNNEQWIEKVEEILKQQTKNQSDYLLNRDGNHSKRQQLSKLLDLIS